jgi:hypothetical protein
VTPDMPNIKLPQPWEYSPKAPFWFVKSPMTVVDSLDLSEAITMFAQHATPAHGTRMAYVCDRAGVIVVGYYTHEHCAPFWLGLEVGFELLYNEPLVETLEIMLAEMQAKETADGR